MQLTALRRVSSRALMPEPLLPAPLRLLAAVLLGACVAVPVVLAVHFVGRGHPGWLDAAIDTPIMNGWRYSTLSQRLSDLGTLGPVALMSLTLVVACVATRRWSGAVLAAVAVPAAIGLTEYVLKPYIGGPLDASFPSGHATSVFALAAVCAVLLANPPRRRVPGAIRLLLVFMALALAAVIAVTTVAWGAHTFTEALAGSAVGAGVALACALAIDLLISRMRRAEGRSSALPCLPSGPPASR
jgi:membrane-associated phospholipid phosphatase